jgi:hypothetical protein
MPNKKQVVFKEAPPMVEFAKNNFSLVLVLVIGLLAQGIFISWDGKDTPNKTAVEFVKAFYRLDPKNMEKNLCDAIKSKGFVDQYLQGVALSASARGFQTSYLKTSLVHLQTDVLENSGATATIRLTAKQRKSINPVYEYVGKMFFLLDESDIEQTVKLIKENNQWKECGGSMFVS